MSRIYAVAGAILLAALVSAAWLWAIRARQDSMFAECGGGQIAGGSSQIGGPFELVDSDGNTVTDKDVLTQPSLLYFGYTFCPDVCPLDASRNAEAVDILEQRGVMVTPVFISIDPKRDTPEAVGDFAANLHERMIGLTGSPSQVKAASLAYKTYYKAHDADDEYYLVDHSTFSYLVLPEYGFVEFFRRDIAPDDMADKIQCFVEKAK